MAPPPPPPCYLPFSGGDIPYQALELSCTRPPAFSVRNGPPHNLKIHHTFFLVTQLFPASAREGATGKSMFVLSAGLHEDVRCLRVRVQRGRPPRRSCEKESSWLTHLACSLRDQHQSTPAVAELCRQCREPKCLCWSKVGSPHCVSVQCCRQPYSGNTHVFSVAPAP